MSLFYLKFSLSLFFLLVIPLLLIRAQPYDDHELRAFLMPEGCELPCFMGIQPGVTTVDEAVRLLEASGWAENIQVMKLDADSVDTIRWSWNGKQPAYIQGRTAGVLHVLGSIDPSQDINQIGHVVMSIWFQSEISYGSLFLALGGGEFHEFYQKIYGEYMNARISTYYPDYQLFVTSPIIACPVTASRYWNSQVIFESGYAAMDGVAFLCPGQ